MRMWREFSREDGASAVEFALVCVILLVLLTGIVQFGMTLFQYVELVAAAREGARWSSMGFPGGSIGSAGTTRNKVYLASGGLQGQMTDGDISISVAGSGREDPTVADMNQPVTVTVRAQSEVIIPMVNIIGRNTIDLAASSTMKVE